MCLTGGSSALPRLDDLVADRFGGLTAEDGRRKLAVVLGAAAGPVPVATTSATAVTPSEVAAGAPAGAGAAAEPQGQAPATPPTAKVVSAAMTRQDPPPPPIAGVGAVAAIAPQPPAPGPTGEPPGAIAQTPRIPARGPRTPASQSTTGPGSSGRERLLPAALVLGSGIVALAILALPWLPGLSDESGIGLIGILWDPSLRGAYPLVVTALAGLSLVVVGAAWVIGQRSTRPGSVLAIAAGAALVIAPIELILRFEDWTETVGPPPLFAIVAGVVALAGAAVAARQTRLDQRWPAVLVAAGGLAGLIGLGAALVVDDRGLSPMDLASDFLRLLGPVPPVCALASLVLIGAAIAMSAAGVVRVAGRGVALAASVVLLLALAYALVAVATNDFASYVGTTPEWGFFLFLAAAAVGFAGSVIDYILTRQPSDTSPGAAARHVGSGQGPRW